MRAFIDWLNLSYKESRSISYDYALIKFIEKLENGKNPLGIDLSKIDLLIVDEFQDSNPAQMAIVKCILKKNPKMKLLLLGDIDQTIYTWRGTDLVFLDEFINEYSSQGDAYYERVFLENTHRLGK
jgi:DNA helicase-2/ATP-dependent DNA helicase PcrA